MRKSRTVRAGTIITLIIWKYPYFSAAGARAPRSARGCWAARVPRPPRGRCGRGTRARSARCGSSSRPTSRPPWLRSLTRSRADSTRGSQWSGVRYVRLWYSAPPLYCPSQSSIPYLIGTTKVRQHLKILVNFVPYFLVCSLADFHPKTIKHE